MWNNWVFCWVWNINWVLHWVWIISWVAHLMWNNWVFCWVWNIKWVLHWVWNISWVVHWVWNINWLANRVNDKGWDSGLVQKRLAQYWHRFDSPVAAWHFSPRVRFQCRLCYGVRAYSPRMQSYASTSVRTLKIPNYQNSLLHSPLKVTSHHPYSPWVCLLKGQFPSSVFPITLST